MFVPLSWIPSLQTRERERERDCSFTLLANTVFLNYMWISHLVVDGCQSWIGGVKELSMWSKDPAAEACSG